MARCVVLCVGAAASSSSGAAYIFSDMVTGARSCNVWRGVLSYVLAQQSCLVMVPPIFLMIWSLARFLAPCGEVCCLVLAQKSSSGATYIVNDMVTSALSCTMWRGMLSCVPVLFR